MSRNNSDSHIFNIICKLSFYWDKRWETLVKLSSYVEPEYLNWSLPWETLKQEKTSLWWFFFSIFNHFVETKDRFYVSNCSLVYHIFRKSKILKVVLRQFLIFLICYSRNLLLAKIWLCFAETAQQQLKRLV